SDPMLQNTNCCSASWDEMNCTKATSALKANTSAMPNNTTVSTPAPRMRAMACSSSTEPKAHRKALSGTTQSAGTPGMLDPSTMPTAAPKYAADDTPSVKGLASGLLRMVCISAPASDSEAPTSRAASA